MFVDDGRGWGQPQDPAPRASLTPRQERIVLNLVLLVAFLMLIAPIGGGTIIEAVVALVGAMR